MTGRDEEGRVAEPEATPARRDPAVLLAIASRLAWPIAVVAVALMLFVFFRDARAPEEPGVRTVHAGATVVRELRALSRLETSVLRVEKIIELSDRQRRLYGLVDADDRLLFVAAGEVVLGVDLAKLGEGDVRADPDTGVASIALREPEILSTRFDEERSYVHSRKTDLLAKRSEGLEAMARREALAAFAAAGRDPRAMLSARVQAEAQLRALAKAWGATDLVVTWKGPAGEVPVD